MQVLDHITDGEQYELEFVGRFTDMLYLLGSSLMVVCIRCWLQNQDIMNLGEYIVYNYSNFQMLSKVKMDLGHMSIV